jgi:hypothetical protein
MTFLLAFPYFLTVLAMTIFPNIVHLAAPRGSRARR